MRIFNKDPKISLPDYETAPGKKIFENLLFGPTLKCSFNPKIDRQKVIKKMRVGDPVALRPANVGYAETFIVIDAKTGLDIGEVSPGTYEYIWEHFPKHTKFVGRVKEIWTDKGYREVKIEYRAYWE